MNTIHRYAFAYVLIIFCFSIVLLLPPGSSLRLNSETENRKSGLAGEDITYNISVTNDNFYPIDIKAELSESTWDTSIENYEFQWVQPGEKVRITVRVHIPGNPNCSSSISDIDLFERPSTDGRTAYEHELSIELNTMLSESDRNMTDTGIWGDMSSATSEFAIPFLVVILISHLAPFSFLTAFSKQSINDSPENLHVL